MAFAPQKTIEVVKEKKKLLARNSKLEEQVVSQSERIAKLEAMLAKQEAMLAKQEVKDVEVLRLLSKCETPK